MGLGRVRVGDQLRQVAPMGLCASYLPQHERLFVTRVIRRTNVELSTGRGGSPLVDSAGKAKVFSLRYFTPVATGKITAVRPLTVVGGLVSFVRRLIVRVQIRIEMLKCSLSTLIGGIG